MKPYLINLKDKRLGFYTAHYNSNGTSYCGKVTMGPQIVESDTIDYDCIPCLLCKHNPKFK